MSACICFEADGVYQISGGGSLWFSLSWVCRQGAETRWGKASERSSGALVAEGRQLCGTASAGGAWGSQVGAREVWGRRAVGTVRRLLQEPRFRYVGYQRHKRFNSSS